MKATLAATRIIWQAPGAAAAALRSSGVRRPLLRRAHIAILRFLDGLVGQGARPPSQGDETDWPRFPGI